MLTSTPVAVRRRPPGASAQDPAAARNPRRRSSARVLERDSPPCADPATERIRIAQAATGRVRRPTTASEPAAPRNHLRRSRSPGDQPRRPIRPPAFRAAQLERRQLGSSHRPSPSPDAATDRRPARPSANARPSTTSAYLCSCGRTAPRIDQPRTARVEELQPRARAGVGGRGAPAGCARAVGQDCCWTGPVMWGAWRVSSRFAAPLISPPYPTLLGS